MISCAEFNEEADSPLFADDLYSDGATIQSYLQSMAYRYQILHSNTMFHTEVVSAIWNEDQVLDCDSHGQFQGRIWQDD